MLNPQQEHTTEVSFATFLASVPVKILQAICTEEALAHLQSLASVRSAAWWHLIAVKGWSCFISAPAEF